MAATEDNQRVYESSDAITTYRQPGAPHQAERVMFDPLAAELRTARLLDIGIGAGRTTEFLPPMVARYVGIDYSRGLVEAARQLHPDLEIVWGDARDLSMFEDGSFDVVYFSFNGLDALDHEGRLAVHREVHRVLAPGGRWMFSSHNRAYELRGLLPWQRGARPTLRLLKQTVHALISTRNRRRIRGQQVETSEYALVNDDAHRYSMLHYYIAAEDQVRQLEDAGFTEVVVRSQEGTSTTTSPPDSIWLHYTCRRGPATA